AASRGPDRLRVDARAGRSFRGAASVSKVSIARLGNGLLSPCAAAFEETGAGLIVASAAFARLGGGLFLERLQVRQVRSAKRAADRLQVTLDVVAPGGVEVAEEKAAELLAGGTTEALAAPDGPERVLAAIALLHQGTQGLA